MERPFLTDISLIFVVLFRRKLGLFWLIVDLAWSFNHNLKHSAVNICLKVTLVFMLYVAISYFVT
jgi:hypothetical protein